jgi:hypothetical protein
VELFNGMLSLAEKFMIERSISSLLFIRKCRLSQSESGAKINCSGFPPKKEHLGSKISSKPCPLQKVAGFLGRVCGGPSLPQGLFFLCGRRHLEKFLLWII